MKRVLAVICALAGAAHAETIGVVVTGDATLQPLLMSAFTQQLEQGGHDVVAAPLAPAALGMLSDCLVIEDPGCAQTLVERDARSPSVLYVTGEGTTARETRIVVHYFVKGREPVVRRETCSDCVEARLLETAATLVAALVPEGPRRTEAVAHVVDRERAGIALGVELGEPTSATGAWYAGRLAVLTALGTGTFEGPGFSFHADVQLAVARIAANAPVRIGLGARYYHHGYEPMSVDEIPHSHYGLRASAAIGYERGPLELYAELAPGVDLRRTRSCTFASGVDTICPHAQERPVFVQFVVGARWFLFP